MEKQKEIDTQEDADIKITKPLSDEDKGMLMHDITNILADNFCTIEDAEDILNGTLKSIRVTSKVERLKW